MKSKTILALAMALCMSVSVAGCGSSDSSSGSSDSSSGGSGSNTAASAGQKGSGLPSDITDNLYDKRARFGSEVLGVPVSVGDLEDAGWVCKSPDNTVSGKKGCDIDFEKDSQLITAHVYNNAEEGSGAVKVGSDEGKSSLTVTYISMLSVLNDDGTVKSGKIALPKGIETGATIEQVKAAYGEPAKTKETYAPGGGNRDGFVYTYQESGKKSYVELIFKGDGSGSKIAKESTVKLQGVKICHSLSD